MYRYMYLPACQLDVNFYVPQLQYMYNVYIYLQVESTMSVWKPQHNDSACMLIDCTSIIFVCLTILCFISQRPHIYVYIPFLPLPLLSCN